MNKQIKNSKIFRTPVASTPLNSIAFNGSYDKRYNLTRWDGKGVCHS